MNTFRKRQITRPMRFSSSKAGTSENVPECQATAYPLCEENQKSITISVSMDIHNAQTNVAHFK